MRYDLDTVKTVASDHSVEIATAAVAAGMIGAVCYNNKKQREHEIALAKLQLKASRPPWYSHLGRRRSKCQHIMDPAQ